VPVLAAFITPIAGENAERARLIGRGGYHAAADVVAQAEKASTSVGQEFGLLIATAADDHGQAAQFGVAQEFDRRIEGVHVEMGDAARCMFMVGDRYRKLKYRGVSDVAVPVWARIATEA
jgi:hypothetical protein